MTLNAIKIHKENTAIINSIVEVLMEGGYAQVSAIHLEKLLTDNRTYLLAAMLNGKVIGYALAYRFPSLYSDGYIAYLYDIEVVKTHRRKGAGRLLIENLRTQLKADGVNELWLGTATDNAAGQAFFSSTGGIRSGETFNDFTYEL